MHNWFFPLQNDCKIILCCLYFSTKCYILRRCKDDLWKLRKNKMKQKLNNITLLFVLVLMTLPNLGQLIFGLPTGTKQLVRRYERCSFKIIHAKCGQTFISMCIREGLLPKYSNIYTLLVLKVVGTKCCAKLRKNAQMRNF